MPSAFITHPDCLLHDMGADHPECPERLQAIEDRLIAAGLRDFLLHADAPDVTREQLERVHDERYLTMIEEGAPKAGIVHVDPDTAMNRHTLAAARRAAGAVVHGVDLVMQGKARTAFCAVRPPGHHAERHRAMGFCFYNNVAVGIAHAMAAWGLSRIAIADFDVHHGNGTEHIFADDNRVLMVSTFQHPFYPYSGAESRSHHMINVPLRAGSRGAQFRAAVEDEWLPVLDAFRPEMVFVSAGFDAHIEDDMASIGLVEEDYRWVTRHLKAVADRHAQGRVVSVLEGGYALSALGRSVETHIRELAGL